MDFATSVDSSFNTRFDMAWAAIFATRHRPSPVQHDSIRSDSLFGASTNSNGMLSLSGSGISFR